MKKYQAQIIIRYSGKFYPVTFFAHNMEDALKRVKENYTDNNQLAFDIKEIPYTEEG